MDWHNVSQWGALLGVLSAGGCWLVIRFGILPMLKRQRGIDECAKGSANQGLEQTLKSRRQSSQNCASLSKDQ